jgi:hypothetical protein
MISRRRQPKLDGDQPTRNQSPPGPDPDPVTRRLSPACRTRCCGPSLVYRRPRGRATDGAEGPLRGHILVHAGHVDHVGVVDEAHAHVGEHRVRVDRQALQFRDDGSGRDLGVGIGHVSRLGHALRDLDRIADHVHMLGRRGLEGQEIHVAPARIGIGQAGLHDQVTSTHRRQHVQHVGLDVVLDLELDGIGARINRHRLVLAAILDHRAVDLAPGLLEQRPLAGDVGIAVEDQHLGARLLTLEVGRDHTRTFVRPWRATVGRFGDHDRISAAIGHGFELPAQRHRLRTGLPAMQDAALSMCGLQSLDLVPHHVHTWRQHHLVVTQRAPVLEHHLPLRDVDRRDTAAHQAHAVARSEIVIGDGDVGDLPEPRQHQIADRAGDKGRGGFDQGDVDALVGEHADVLGHRGAAPAGTDHYHLWAGAAQRGASCHRTQ